MAPAIESDETRGERLAPLDGLRGVAAIAVLFYHALPHAAVAPRVMDVLPISPLGPLVNGPGAVHVFFVLSGYVLTLTLSRDTAPGRIARFYVRRVFRIMPPYVAAVLLAWVVSQLLVAPGQDGPLPWVPASRLPRALVFPSMAFGLLPVGWSLYVEMAMSIVFPLLLVLGARIHPVAPVALSFAFLGELDPRFGFLRFTIDFALGMWLRLEAARVSAAFGRLPGWAPATAAVLGLALLQVPYLPGFASTGFAGLERGHTPAAVVVLALGSALLVAGTLHSKGWSRALSTPLARLYGRISYSFYLVHHTVLMVFVLHAPGHVFSWPTALGVTALAFAATSLLGELGWRAVELPAIRAGRALVGAAQAWVRPRPAS